MSFYVPMFASLDDARAAYIREIDDYVGQIRQEHITDIPGQAEMYTFKAQEMERYYAEVAAGTTPDPADYLFLPRTQSAYALPTLAAAAALIKARRDMWLRYGARVEGLREGAKQEVLEATTARQMEQIARAARAQLRAISDEAHAARANAGV